MRRFVLQLLALLPIPVILALVVWASGRPGPPPLSLKETRHKTERASLPAAFAPDWQRDGPLQTFDQKGLFDRINGAAPVYIDAGFQYSLGADYRKTGDTDPVQIDVYDMGTPVQAFGMYASECDPSYSFLAIGDGGYLASGSLNFWHKRYYVKLAGYDMGEAMDAKLTELGRALVKALGTGRGGARVKARLALLPSEGRQAHTDGFSRADLDGIPGLEQAFFARYQEEDVTYRLFLVSAPKPGAVAERLARIKAHFAEQGAVLQPREVPGLKVLAATRDDRVTLLVIGKRSIAGGLDLPGDAAELTSQVVERLRSTIVRTEGTS